MSNVLISSEIGSECGTILGHPQLIEYIGVCVLSLAHESELRGSDVYPHIVKNFKKLIWKFFFNFSQDTCPWVAFAWIFFGIFLKK